MKGLFLAGLMILGTPPDVDLDELESFESARWSVASTFLAVSQETVHMAGVRNADGSGYLAAVCVEGGAFELRASVGRYIGIPRVKAPMKFLVQGRSLDFSPQSRVDYFWWRGSEAQAVIDALPSHGAVKAQFALWDASVHQARFSVDGMGRALRQLRGKCRGPGRN